MWPAAWSELLSNGLIVGLVAVAAVGLIMYDMFAGEFGKVVMGRVRVAEVFLVVVFIALVGLRFHTLAA